MAYLKRLHWVVLVALALLVAGLVHDDVAVLSAQTDTPAVPAAPLNHSAADPHSNWVNLTHESNINVFLQQGSVLWIGTWGGLLRWDLNNDTFKKYTPADGLAGRLVYALTLDKQGRLWIGTDRGLSRFDGQNWLAYTKENSGLPGDSVRAIATDDQGHIWLDSRDQNGQIYGLTLFDGAKWTVYNESNSELADNSIGGLLVDRQGHVWMGSRFGDVSRFNGAQWTVYPDITYNHNSVSVVGEDPQGRIWFSTYSGTLVVFDGNVWEQVTPFDECRRQQRGTSLDDQGKIWRSTLEGLCVYDGSTWKRHHKGNSNLPNDKLGVVAAAGGNVWVGYADGEYLKETKFTRFDHSKFHDYNKPEDLPVYMYGHGLAYQEETWFSGAQDETWQIWDGVQWSTVGQATTGWTGRCINATTVDGDDHLWFAGGNCSGGLMEYTGSEWIQHSGSGGIPDTLVFAVAVDKLNRLWGGSRMGLSVYDGGAWTTYNTSNSDLPNNQVNRIVTDDAGNIWVNCTTRFDGATWKTYATIASAVEDNYEDIKSTIDPDHRCWLVDGAERVWAYTPAPTKKIALYNGSAWTNYSPSEVGIETPPGISESSWILSLKGVDPAGNMWAGIQDGNGSFGAVSRFEGKTKTWTMYRQPEGLIEPPREMTVDHQGRLWFGDGSYFSIYFDPWQPATATIDPNSAIDLLSPDRTTTIRFAKGGVTQPVVVEYQAHATMTSGELGHIGRFFDLSATQNGAPISQFATPYQIEVRYKQAELNGVREETLALYWWNKDRWVREPSSQVDTVGNKVAASPDHMTVFAVLGETNRCYLPAVVSE